MMNTERFKRNNVKRFRAVTRDKQYPVSEMLAFKKPELASDDIDERIAEDSLDRSFPNSETENLTETTSNLVDEEGYFYVYPHCPELPNLNVPGLPAHKIQEAALHDFLSRGTFIYDDPNRLDKLISEAMGVASFSLVQMLLDGISERQQYRFHFLLSLTYATRDCGYHTVVVEDYNKNMNKFFADSTLDIGVSGSVKVHLPGRSKGQIKSQSDREFRNFVKGICMPLAAVLHKLAETDSNALEKFELEVKTLAETFGPEDPSKPLSLVYKRRNAIAEILDLILAARWPELIVGKKRVRYELGISKLY